MLKLPGQSFLPQWAEEVHCPALSQMARMQILPADNFFFSLQTFLILCLSHSAPDYSIQRLGHFLIFNLHLYHSLSLVFFCSLTAACPCTTRMWLESLLSWPHKHPIHLFFSFFLCILTHVEHGNSLIWSTPTLAPECTQHGACLAQQLKHF